MVLDLMIDPKRPWFSFEGMGQIFIFGVFVVGSFYGTASVG